MRRFIDSLIFVLSLAVLAYIAVPLFAVPKKYSTQSASVAGSTVPNTVVNTLKEAAKTVESALNPNSKCQVPFHYAIGTVDPRFGISKDALKEDLLKAESIWESASKENVLQYDDQSDFRINLVFDERQQQTIESKKLQQKLDDVQTLQKGISKEYDTLSLQYDKQKSNYENDVKKYRQLADDYDTQVQYWNNRGGAPADTYQQLRQQKKEVTAAADNVEGERRNLNALVAQVNALVAKEKKVVASYNQNVTTYESAFGGEKEFDQGVYTGKEINIYQFSETNDLVLVLAHELGHALGMNHVENPQSIMYYLMAKQNLDHPSLSAKDVAALKNRCL
jgi:hypothetical protein